MHIPPCQGVKYVQSEEHGHRDLFVIAKGINFNNNENTRSKGKMVSMPGKSKGEILMAWQMIRGKSDLKMDLSGGIFSPPYHYEG